MAFLTETERRQQIFSARFSVQQTNAAGTPSGSVPAVPASSGDPNLLPYPQPGSNAEYISGQGRRTLIFVTRFARQLGLGPIPSIPNLLRGDGYAKDAGDPIDSLKAIDTLKKTEGAGANGNGQLLRKDVRFAVKDAEFKDPTNPLENGFKEGNEKITIIKLPSARASVGNDFRSINSIDLHFIPRNLNVTPGSQFKAIPSIARNIPYYHYTGSEQTLEFEVEWYASDYFRLAAIQGCRFMQAMTMSDGYNEDPPRLKIVWGSRNSLFRNSIWLLTEAPYELKQFSKNTVLLKSPRNREQFTINPDSLLPVQATQRLKFVKVEHLVDGASFVENPTWDDIVKEATSPRKANPDFLTTPYAPSIKINI